MKTWKGIPVSPGVGFAPAVVIGTEDFDVPERHVPVDRARAELDRLQRAVEVSRREIRDLQQRTVSQIGEQTSSIFDFHLGMLDDSTLHEQFSEAILNGHVTAEYAVAAVLRGYARGFRSMPEYLAERVRDVYDVERRLLRNLTGQRRQGLAHLQRDVVVLAADLTPSQTAGMDRGHVRGLALDAGGKTTHTAIVARALGIPAVVGLGDITGELAGGEPVIVDGNRGLVVAEPDAETRRKYEQFARRQVEHIHELDALRDLPAITEDGHEVRLLGNIEFPSEAATVRDKGGDGIGLYRTEFLYLGSDTDPSEEEHYRAYREVIDACPDRPIVIRTVDLGADKHTQARVRTPERNPMLGCRSIRYCLRHLPMFRTQLRAILRAGQHGQASMLFPLITNLLELRQAKAIVRDVIEDLEEEGRECREDMPIGMMVETPSAALQIDAFAKEVDFFSLGTNDLVQYTLAVDRGNPRVASLFSGWHPAVLRLIREVIRSGQRHGVPVTVCGEIAADPVFTLPLLGMGLRSFSCVPSAIPEIKKMVRSVTIEHANRTARRILGFDSDKEILNYLRAELRALLPEAIQE